MPFFIKSIFERKQNSGGKLSVFYRYNGDSFFYEFTSHSDGSRTVDLFPQTKHPISITAKNLGNPENYYLVDPGIAVAEIKSNCNPETGVCVLEWVGAHLDVDTMRCSLC